MSAASTGCAEPRIDDIPMLVDLWRRGQLNIADAVTNRYPLAQVLSQGYQDLEDGKNIRGVVVHADAP